MTYEIDTSIDITAPTWAVWAVLTDLPRYTGWNPFIISASGTVAPGNRLTITVMGTDASRDSFRPIVTAAEPERLLQWKGRVLLDGIFDAQHTFTLDPIAEGVTRVRHRECFSGLLLPIMQRKIERHVKPMFDRMNGALRDQAERLRADV